jgi:hypothetical protein
VSDLTAKEQGHVRTAILFLRARCGGLKPLAKALRTTRAGLNRPASASVAVRVALLAGVGVDDVLAGNFPPAGTCPHGGRASDGTLRAARRRGTPIALPNQVGARRVVKDHVGGAFSAAKTLTASLCAPAGRSLPQPLKSPRYSQPSTATAVETRT